jgi:predicted MFS family arabinose efflux permease
MSSLLLVGLAPNFWVALAGRIIGGALNGNIGVIQTMLVLLVRTSFPWHKLTIIKGSVK